ncbi:MAG: hypothetical protein OXH37_06500 [Gammaproteobacteria bacterium]|nr:hypothetical protein [Gammaproteobacteria bacterium]
MRISGYGLAAIAALSLLAHGTAIAQLHGEPSPTAITTDDCLAAWGRAAASATCTTTALNAESQLPGGDMVNNCAVKANCASETGGEHDTFSDYHGGPAGVETLVNCGGTLSTTSC